MSDPAALSTLVAVARALRAAGARYFVAGSFASSLQGVPRATLDVDLVVDLPVAGVPAFVAALGKDFYADGERIEAAIRGRASSTAIDLRSGFKADCYLLGDDEFSRSRMRRAVPTEIGAGAPEPFSTAEDLELQNPRWYRDGGEVPEQWSEVVGVLRVGRKALDREYLANWAATLGVGDLPRSAWDEPD